MKHQDNKIIGSSYQQEDIDEMYKVKDQLLLNYKNGSKVLMMFIKF